MFARIRRRRRQLPRYPVEGGEAYLEVAQGRLLNQFGQIERMESKLTAMMQTGLGEVALVIAVLTIKPAAEPFSGWPLALLIVSALLTIMLSVVWFIGTRIQPWKSYPSTTDAWKAAHSDQSTAWDLARTLEVAHDGNLPAVNAKERTTRLGQWVISLLTIASISTAFLLAAN